MHSAIEKMPQIAAIVDSLRAIDPFLLVLSGGDNRTGNPYNDLYEPVSYPMVSMMNLIGFDASALGNHEYDSKVDGLAKVISLSNFPYLAANISCPPETGWSSSGRGMPLRLPRCQSLLQSPSVPLHH